MQRTLKSKAKPITDTAFSSAIGRPTVQSQSATTRVAKALPAENRRCFPFDLQATIGWMPSLTDRILGSLTVTYEGGRGSRSVQASHMCSNLATHPCAILV